MGGEEDKGGNGFRDRENGEISRLTNLYAGEIREISGGGWKMVPKRQ